MNKLEIKLLSKCDIDGEDLSQTDEVPFAPRSDGLGGGGNGGVCASYSQSLSLGSAKICAKAYNGLYSDGLSGGVESRIDRYAV